MTYDEMLYRTLTDLGFDLVPVYNCFQPPYDQHTGWPLKLPDVEFTNRTLVLLNFQDFVTPGDSIRELELVEQHYRDRSGQVLVTYMSHGLEKHYQGAINLIEFSNHSLTTVTTLAQRRSEWMPAFSQSRDIAWQCLNGRMCQHRRRVVDVLLTCKSPGVLSWGNEIALRDWPYSTYRGTENDDNFLRLVDLYSRARVNIVTETQYDARPGVISEKTLHAMIAGQMPLIIGHPGAVQDTQDLGFDVFPDVVDTSYDWMPNDSRVEAALARNRHLLLGDLDWTALAARLQANREHALDRLPERMLHDFRRAAQNLAAQLLPR